MGNNIPVPYSTYITGLGAGREVSIGGRPTPNADKFSINLCTNSTVQNGDVALHFNPRFKQGCVVRNHKQGHSWGAEETAGGNPFRRGETFNINIRISQNGYKVTVNGMDFCDFTHRLPVQRVTNLYIAGDVIIDFINDLRHPGGSGRMHSKAFGKGRGDRPDEWERPVFHPPPRYSPPSYPTIGFAAPPTQLAYPAPAAPLVNPPVPLITPIPGGMYPGKMIAISGAPRPGASRFGINLACGAGDNSDLALHFNPRFNSGSDRNVVVRNHKQGGNWGAEERHQTYFPFAPGVNFEVLILCEPRCMKVAVNNQHFTEFNHRIQKLQRIDYLQVKGDVTVSQVRFQ